MSDLPDSDLPDYDELPVIEGKPRGSTWGLWGDDDEVGTVNMLTAEHVKHGLASAREGKVFSLNWDLELPNPPFFGREPLRQVIKKINPNAHDDYYDSFYPQQSSQWDALSHVGHPDHGYYNGRTGDEFTGTQGARNGIEHWARRGIVGRGVLLDIPRYLASRGIVFEPNRKVEFGVDDFAGTASYQGVELQEGDILLVRTGWLGWYEHETSPEQRIALADAASGALQIAGLAGGRDLVKYLWDSHVVAIATDNPTFEAWPREMIVGDYLHFELLALLGMPIGELFYLEALAEDCASDGRYDFLFTSAPLNKVGGIGSPPNALAIK